MNLCTGRLAAMVGLVLAMVTGGCGGGSSGGAISAEPVQPANQGTSGLLGRAWAAGQIIESDDNPVTDFRTGIDDAGRSTVLFLKSNESRLVLYSTRGIPGTSSNFSWTTPAPIDVLNGLPVNGMTATTALYGLHVAPGGNAVAYWADGSGYVVTLYTARFLIKSNSWEQPIAFGRFNAGRIEVQINDKGDVALGGPAPRSNLASRWTLAWRGDGQASVSEQVFMDARVFYPSIRLGQAGELLVTASFEESSSPAIYSIYSYRGNVASPLAAGQKLSTLPTSSSLLATAIGVRGEQLVVWRQNNGTRSSLFAAFSQGTQSSWIVSDLDRDGEYEWVSIDDAGIVRFTELGAQPRRFTGNGSTWTAPEVMPFSRTSGDACVTAREGNVLCINGYTGLWLSYDAQKGTVVQPRLNPTPGSGYILGFQSNTTVSFPNLSTSGIAVAVTPIRLDVLPTQINPLGIGRGISNLWGFYLK